MKRVFLSLVFCTSLFANCKDVPIPGGLSSISQAQYEQGEAKIFSEINKLNSIIKEQIIKTEQESELLNQQLLEMSKFNHVSKEKINFLLEQQNQLQSIISTIKAN